MESYLPKVSVMIPTYNQEQYIAEAIESVLMQDYENLEVVISDDCSTDSTSEIIKKYINDKRVKYIRNEINLGRVGNYHNTLYNHTTGDWVVNLDGDDYYTDNNFISRAIENIQMATRYSNNIVAYIYKHLNLDKIKKTYSYHSILDDCIMISGRTYFLDYYKIGAFGHLRTIYKRSIAVKLGDCYTKQYQASDFHSIIRIIMQGDILLDKKNISYWRVHSNNTTVKEINIKKKDLLRAYDDIEFFAKKYFSEKELNIWRKGMNKYADRDFASTHAYICHNFKSLWLLLKVFRFEYGYFRTWFFLIFRY